jgi:hypothetical protein
MLQLKRLLFNMGYARINILKAVASIISLCSLRAFHLTKITPRYFHNLQGDIPSIQRKMSLSVSKSARKVDGPSLIFIGFYISTLTPHLNNTELAAAF